jgi:hypothetical protein
VFSIIKDGKLAYVNYLMVQNGSIIQTHTVPLEGKLDETEDELEAGFEKRTDGLWGVYGFKRGWGGHVARSVGAWDKVYNPLVYAAYWAATQLREG